MPYFGAHLSIQKGFQDTLENARKIGCQSLQAFPSNPRGRGIKKISEEEIALIKKTAFDLKLAGHFCLHMPYYINLASFDEKIWHLSCQIIANDLIFAERIGATAVVIHLGNHKGKGKEAGLRRAKEGLKKIFSEAKNSQTTLLIENSGGMGTSIGNSFEDLADILKEFSDLGKIGVCFDICHAFAFGYDFGSPEAIEKTFQEFDRKIGLHFLRLVHLSDPKGERGSKLDRHLKLGTGKLGLNSFKNIVNSTYLKDLDLILETPYDSLDELKENLDTLKQLYDFT